MKFKLLPQTEQRRLNGEYKTRLVVVFLLFLFAVEVSCTIFMIPSFVLSKVKDQKASGDLASVVKNHDKIDRTVLSSQIKSARKQMADLAVSTTTLPVLSLFSRIVESRAPGVRLSQMEIVRMPNGATTTITVSGISSSRESLVTFTKTLSNEKSFKKVELPVSEFARNKDINFNIKISGKF